MASMIGGAIASTLSRSDNLFSSHLQHCESGFNSIPVGHVNSIFKSGSDDTLLAVSDSSSK